MLKLISSNPTFNIEFYEKPQKIIQPIERIPFASEVLPQGPNLYVIRAQDLSHYLECDLTLEVEDGQDENEPNSVICHFPNIADEDMNRFINYDETLYDILMLEFQMKVLKQLLHFCTTHYASILTIYADDAQADTLKIYRDLLNSTNPTFPQNEERAEIIIKLNQYTMDSWTNFMNQAILEFKQTLWQEQRINPAIRLYLKSHPFG